MTSVGIKFTNFSENQLTTVCQEYGFPDASKGRAKFVGGIFKPIVKYREYPS